MEVGELIFSPKRQTKWQAQMKRFYYLIVCFLFLFSFSGLAYAGSAMVVTADARATNAAGEILRRGGSAVDAAIAAQMVLGLVEPQSSGIGGGAFLLHKVGWFSDRDNSMTPISTEKGVGAAMAIVFGVLRSQAIQVCPGVYLATAHGVLDNPFKARFEYRPRLPPSESLANIAPYPLSEETLMLADVTSYVSPRIVDKSYVWRNPATDYIFMKVDKPLKPDHFIRPIEADTKRIIEASQDGEIKIHGYRPLSLFKSDENGVPDFKTDVFSRKLYQRPQRVNEACQHVVGTTAFRSSGYFLGSSCPNEPGISGSPELTTIRGQNYLVGIHIKGNPKAYDRFSNDTSNIVLDSSKFCKDYEAVCGAPCADLDEVLYGEEEEDTVPIKVPR